ncbi:hypothetical protein FTV91_19725 [Escherichia coli]|nr:hypothetical protein FTV91_19725 [Escherichia coli]
MRLTPNFSTRRPCDQVEAAVGWKLAVERHNGPTALILSRQNLARWNVRRIRLKRLLVAVMC